MRFQEKGHRSIFSCIESLERAEKCSCWFRLTGFVRGSSAKSHSTTFSCFERCVSLFGAPCVYKAEKLQSLEYLNLLCRVCVHFSSCEKYLLFNYNQIDFGSGVMRKRKRERERVCECVSARSDQIDCIQSTLARHLGDERLRECNGG